MCPVDASVAFWLCAVRTLKRWKFFSRVSRVELHDQGQDFLGHLCQSQVPEAPESPRVLLPGDSAPGLPLRSFSCVDIGIAGSSICVKNNNNNTENNNNRQRPPTTSPFPPLVEIREHPEFHDLMSLDKANWPRCLLWHGWLPMLSGVNGASSWAVDASESAAYLLEVALGRYSSWLISEWILSDDFVLDMAASSLSDHPDVWTDGALFLIILLVFPLLGLHQAEHFLEAS